MPFQFDAFPRQFARTLDRPENELVVSEELVTPHVVTEASRVDVSRAMMSNGPLPLVYGVRAEICGVAADRFPCFVGRWKGSGVLWARSTGHDLYGHVSVAVVVHDAHGIRTAIRL
jgi:hypothetical protein